MFDPALVAELHWTNIWLFWIMVTMSIGIAK